MRTYQKWIVGATVGVVLAASFLASSRFISENNEKSIQKSKEDIQTSISTTTTEYLQSYINSGTIESMLSKEMEKVLTDEQVKEILNTVTKAANKSIEAEINTLKETTLTEAQYESLRAAITGDILAGTDLLTNEEADYLTENILDELNLKIENTYLTQEDVEDIRNTVVSSDSISYQKDFNDIESSIKSAEAGISTVESNMDTLKKDVENNIDGIEKEVSDLKQSISNEKTKNELQAESIQNVKSDMDELKVKVQQIEAEDESGNIPEGVLVVTNWDPSTGTLSLSYSE